MRYFIKKLLFSPAKFVLLAMGILIISGYAFATADGPDYYKVTGVANNDVLNLRATPSVTAKIIAKIPFNATKLENKVDRADKNGKLLPDTDMLIAGREPHWLKIKYKKTIGWVQLRFLEPDED